MHIQCHISFISPGGGNNTDEQTAKPRKLQRQLASTIPFTYLNLFLPRYSQTEYAFHYFYKYSYSIILDNTVNIITRISKFHLTLKCIVTLNKQRCRRQHMVYGRPSSCYGVRGDWHFQATPILKSAPEQRAVDRSAVVRCCM